MKSVVSTEWILGEETFTQNALQVHVDVIHSDRSEQQRENTIRAFRAGGVWVLICTELLGRGIDFKGVSLVVNYDFPPSAVSYIHRIGRTGRAGRRGKAVTFFTEADRPLLRSIATVMANSGCPVPEYMMGLKTSRLSDISGSRKFCYNCHLQGQET